MHIIPLILNLLTQVVGGLDEYVMHSPIMPNRYFQAIMPYVVEYLADPVEQHEQHISEKVQCLFIAVKATEKVEQWRVWNNSTLNNASCSMYDTESLFNENNEKDVNHGNQQKWK